MLLYQHNYLSTIIYEIYVNSAWDYVNSAWDAAHSGSVISRIRGLLMLKCVSNKMKGAWKHCRLTAVSQYHEAEIKTNISSAREGNPSHHIFNCTDELIVKE